MMSSRFKKSFNTMRCVLCVGTFIIHRDAVVLVFYSLGGIYYSFRKQRVMTSFHKESVVYIFPHSLGNDSITVES